MNAQAHPQTGEGPERAYLKDATPRPHSQDARLQWLSILDILSKLAIGIGTLILSGTIGYATLSFNRGAAQRQIQQQQESLTFQRQNAAAQILVAELTTIVQGPGQQRAILLKTLESLDPLLVKQIAESLLDVADTPPARQEAEQIILSSVETARALSLQQHLSNAQKYRDFGLLAAAIREYLAAFKSLPQETQVQLAVREANAREAYERGAFSTSVRLFAQLFQTITQDND